MTSSTSTPRRVQRLFLTGLLTLLPVWLTWVVVKFVFVLLSDTSRPLVQPLLASAAAADAPVLGWLAEPWIQTAIALFATVMVIVLVGWVARRVAGQTLLAWFERLVARVPLAGSIYGSARKLLDMLQTTPDGTQRVVLVDFPHIGMKSIGFVTRVLREDGTGRELAAVYVPTSPSPTSGFLRIVPVDQLTPTDWTMDQAMNLIISGGAIGPDTVPAGPPRGAGGETRPAAVATPGDRA